MSDSSVFDLLVRRWSRLSPLSSNEREAIRALPHTRRTFCKDNYIVREGQMVSECNVLLRGFAFRQKLLRDGARQIISLHIAGEFIDLQNSSLGVADHSVQSLHRSELAAIPRTAILDLADRYPAIRLAMWVDTLIDASIFREWVVNVGRRDARSRIAHLLCELVTRMRWNNAVEDPVDFPLTQEQLADATGLTAVHTNRVIQSLRRDGLIQLSNGLLRVLDWDQLCSTGDFDELYLHQRP